MFDEVYQVFHEKNGVRIQSHQLRMIIRSSKETIIFNSNNFCLIIELNVYEGVVEFVT